MRSVSIVALERSSELFSVCRDHFLDRFASVKHAAYEGSFVDLSPMSASEVIFVDLPIYDRAPALRSILPKSSHRSVLCIGVPTLDIEELSEFYESFKSVQGNLFIVEPLLHHQPFKSFLSRIRAFFSGTSNIALNFSRYGTSGEGSLAQRTHSSFIEDLLLIEMMKLVGVFSRYSISSVNKISESCGDFSIDTDIGRIIFSIAPGSSTRPYRSFAWGGTDHFCEFKFEPQCNEIIEATEYRSQAKWRNKRPSYCGVIETFLRRIDDTLDTMKVRLNDDKIIYGNVLHNAEFLCTSWDSIQPSS